VTDQRPNLLELGEAFISRIEEDPATGHIILHIERAENHQKYTVTLMAQLAINRITFTEAPLSVLGPDGRYTHVGPCFYSRVEPVEITRNI
jgi:hypothetical protein